MTKQEQIEFGEMVIDKCFKALTLQQQKEQLAEVIAERDEAYRTVKWFQAEIRELHLLNIKLLYTNLLFKYYTFLTRDNKVKVVEAFDLVNNIREAKLVFISLDTFLREAVNGDIKFPKVRKTKGKQKISKEELYKIIDELEQEALNPNN